MSPTYAHDERLSPLQQISRIVSSSLPLDQVLQEIAGHAARVTACDACVVYLNDSRSNQLVLRAAQPAPPVEAAQPFFSAPLKGHGVLLGVIQIHHATPPAYRPEQLGFLAFVTEQLTLAISKDLLENANARLRTEMNQRKREISARKVVERAKGILQRDHGMSEADAYFQLRNESRRQRRSMRELAETIVAGENQDRRRVA